MDVRGKRVLVFGDSLTHRGGRADPDGVPALPGVARSGSPGDLLASHLLAAGAGAVRINGRVSRSAINLWRSNNGEDGAAVVAAEAAARPDIVIVFLGTNDLGMNATADAAAFGRIAAAFRGAQVWAVGPPAFARADLNAQAAVVVRTLQGVFGAHRVIDLRPLTADIVVPAQGRAGDGVHFATAGAAKTAQRLAAALAAADNRVDAVTSATPALRAWWPLPVSAAAAAALLVGVAVVVRRRRQLQGLGRAGVAGPTSEPRTLFDPETVPERDRTVLGDELHDAAVRAVKAGAGPLEYMGAGAEGVVFCDGDTAYKAGRPGRGTLALEAAFFERANQIPGAREHVAKFKRYDEVNDVLVRECVRGKRLKWDQEDKVYNLSDALARVMAPYGFSAPERKPDSWIMVRGRGPTLVDGGFAHDRGQQLVKRVLDVLNKRRPATGWQNRLSTLVADVEHERERTIPAKVADRLIARLQAAEPQDPADVARRRLDAEALGAPAVTVKTTQPWAEYGDDMDVHEWVVEDEAAIDGVELRSRHNPKHYALAHRATTGGRWQVTWFDELGPGGDVRRPTLVEALTEGASSNEFDVERVHTKAQRTLRGGGEADDVGRAWDAPQGRRRVVQVQDTPRGRRLVIATEGSTIHELLPPEELAREIHRDEANAASRRKAHAQTAQAVAAAQPPAPVVAFAATLSPTAGGKAIAVLQKQRTFNGRAMSCHTYVTNAVAEGARVAHAPDGARRLMHPDGSFMAEKDLTKTAMDYAAFLTATPAKLAGAGGASRQQGKPGRIARECVECGNATDRICVYCKSPLCVECSFIGECYRCVQARRKGVPAKLAGAGGALHQKYTRAAARVDGRTVLDDVPNTGSIDSSLDNYEVLPGIREVPFTAFDQLDPGPPRYYHSTSEAKRTKQLAAQIRESAEISPLIVVEDAEGPYILEGGHRFDALRELGAQAFPALVVLDLDSLATKP